MFIRGVVLDAAQAQSTGDATEATLCLNRLLWGGLDVASVVQQATTTGANACASGSSGTGGSGSGVLPPGVDSIQLPVRCSSSGTQAHLSGSGGSSSLQAALLEWCQQRGIAPGELLVLTASSSRSNSSSSCFILHQAASQLGALSWSLDTPTGTANADAIAGPQTSPPPPTTSPAPPAGPEEAGWKGLPLRVGRHQHARAPATTALVGYTMKASREADLGGSKLLPLLPHTLLLPQQQPQGQDQVRQQADATHQQQRQQPGLVFVPLDISGPPESLTAQLPLHAVLHKGSDELEAPPTPPHAVIGDEGGCVDSAQQAGMGGGGAPVFSARLQRLRSWLEEMKGRVAVVDPFECTAKVINRLDLCNALQGLEEACTQQLHNQQQGQEQAPAPVPQQPAGDEQQQQQQQQQQGQALRVCAPRWCVLHSLDDGHISQQLAAAGLTRGPFIVKPLAACGLKHSHSMALALHPAALSALGALPLPLLVQEFANHGGQVLKVYVAGGEVFHAVRPSIPDIPQAMIQASQQAWQAAHAAATAGEAVEPVSSPNAPQPLPSSSSPEPSAAEGVLLFDSLKSLPTSLPHQQHPSQEDAPVGSGGTSGIAGGGLTVTPALQGLLRQAAEHIRELLGLSLFGFDVVLEAQQQHPCGGGDAAGAASLAAPPAPPAARQRLLVIDVNYFPSYKATGAAPHFWSTIASAVVAKTGHGSSSDSDSAAVEAPPS